MTKQEIQRKCVGSLLFFMKAIMPKIAHLDSPVFHNELEQAIMNTTRSQVNVVAPRGFAKTTVSAIAGSLWHAYCSDVYKGRKWRPRFVLLVSKSRSHSINLLTTIKNILEYSPEFRELFGYHGMATARIWREDMVVTARGDIFVCRGMGQMVRGLNVNGTRPTYIILDDAEDELNTKTAERMDANLRWLLQAVVPAGAAGDCKIVNIGTPQHQRAIVFTLKDMSTWHSLHYRAIVSDDDGVERSLWPEMRSLQWLEEKKQSLEDIGKVSMFYREYMCEVVGDEDQLFHPDHLTLWWEGEVERDARGKAFLVHKATGQKTPVNLFMGVDPASTITSTADYTVVFTIAVDKDGNRYVVDIVRRRMKPMEVARTVIEQFKKYRPEKTQIETVGYQSMLADYIKETFEGFIPGLAIKNNPRRGKTERLEGLQPLFAQNKVWFRRGLKTQEHFRDELLLFPRGKHEDTIDGFFYANKGAYKPYHDKPQDKEKVKAARRSFDWMVE